MSSKDSTSLHPKLLIVVLVVSIVFALLWLWNPYVATYSTVILSGVMLVILLFSLVADLIEKSRIPKWYYYVLVISIVVPLLIGMFFIYIYGGNMEWMK
jgi:uncharacterized membrane protein HdeD (DUF308 family)